MQSSAPPAITQRPHLAKFRHGRCRLYGLTVPILVQTPTLVQTLTRSC
jgi:hypothetical protein